MTRLFACLLAITVPTVSGAQDVEAPVLEPFTAARVEGRVERSGAGFLFLYRVANSDASGRSVNWFTIAIESDATRSAVDIEGLDDSGSAGTISDINRRNLGNKVVGVALPTPPGGWGSVVAAHGRVGWGTGPLSSGESVEFPLASKGLPGIRIARLEVDRREEVGPYVHEIPGELIIAAMRAANFNTSVVGPVAPLADPVPSAVVQEIDSLRTQARELGWVRSDAASEALRLKLAALSDALAQGDFSLAKRTTRAFLSDVSATGCITFDCPLAKALTAEAYALMFFNMEYLRTLIPNAPPVCTAAEARPNLLWPPNHEMVDIDITGIADPDGDQTTTRSMSVTQDEHVLEPGSGNHCPDAELLAPNGGLRLRAERAGRLNGRVYRVRFEATDDGGATCSGTVKVCMPHEESTTPTCVEDPAVHDSFACP